VQKHTEMFFGMKEIAFHHAHTFYSIMRREPNKKTSSLYFSNFYFAFFISLIHPFANISMIIIIWHSHFSFCAFAFAPNKFPHNFHAQNPLLSVLVLFTTRRRKKKLNKNVNFSY
jgi:hypothetical protein